MPITIQINKHAVEAKVKGAWDKSLPLLAQEIRDDCNDYCKEAEGYLKASSMSHSVLEKGQIIWQTPYARRQYWEIRTAHKDVNPKATWKWCEAAKSACKGKWQIQAQKLLEMKL